MPKTKKRQVKTLIYDIETSPIIGYTWGVWQQNVIEVQEDWQILTVAWRWLGEKKVHVIGQDDFKGYKPGVNNDKKVVQKIHELFDEADIIVAHNGNSFDAKKCRARMIQHKMLPPSPYKQIDTKVLAKRYGAFTRNSLKSLAKDLDISQKGDPGGFKTWLGCLAGDPKAWKTMKKYNVMDIPPLEELYMNFLPWITNHPNAGTTLQNHGICPKCESDRLQKRGFNTKAAGKVQRYQCQNCGGWCSEASVRKKGRVVNAN